MKRIRAMAAKMNKTAGQNKTAQKRRKAMHPSKETRRTHWRTT